MSKLCSLNNIYDTFPALMSDTRYITSYKGNQQLNDHLKQKNNIQTNYDYRMFLTQNGERIMDINRMNYCNAQGVCVYKNDSPHTSQKYLFRGQNDLHKPIGYETSDLKQDYIDRQSLQSRLYTPLLTQHQMLRFMREK